MSPDKLAREVKKKRPFDQLEEEVALNLLRTSDRLEHALARIFRSHGLTSPQYNVLRILRGEGQPLPILEIASRTIAVVPAITGLIDRLEQHGLVARQRCAEDRRVIHVAITQAGLHRLAQLDEPVAAFHKQLFGGFARGDLKELVRLLEQTRERLPSES